MIELASAWALPWLPAPWVLVASALLALLVDHFLGEPPVRWHPVVWMGTLLGALASHVAPAEGAPLRPRRDFWAGALAWFSGAALVTGAALALQWVVIGWGQDQPAWWQVPVMALLLKPLLAWRMLWQEVGQVEQALGQSLPAGRERVAWLVSRDTASLDAQGVREAALSTLAENLCDSVVAPLFWFFVGGLPAAALYRWANTADAMWGYRGARGGRVWTWAGRWAARADDVLSWVPARITGMVLSLCAGVFAGSQAMLFRLKTMRRMARLTPSPNGGWPMGALALGLGIRLEKQGVYVLNDGGVRPEAAHVGQAIRLCHWAAWGACALMGLMMWSLSSALPQLLKVTA